MPSRPPRRRTRVVDEVSAGGLVVDRTTAPVRAVLVGRDRRGQRQWILPKGHLEPGETTEQAACREVQEETGVRARVLRPLGTIDYWFVLDGRRIHKTVHHFLLLAEGGELSTDDVEADEVAWVPLAEVPDRLAFSAERQLAGRAPTLLTGPA